MPSNTYYTSNIYSEESFEEKLGLGYWDCAGKDVYNTLNPLNKGEFLNNRFFREDQERTGYGHDYIVLSIPHAVSDFQPFSFTYPLENVE